jgi:TolA-binding protein
MNVMKMGSCLLAGCAAAAVTLPLAAQAQSLNDVIGVQQNRTTLAQESQQRIDGVVDQTRQLEDQYKAVLKEIDGLRIYNQLLERQIGRQVAKMAELNDSIDRVAVVSRQIAPLMLRMIESVTQFVALDVPFLLEERQARVAQLELLLETEEVTVAERFRKVMEAYQIENDYGRTIEAYTGTLNIDGATRNVEFLRIGRIALLYQTADGKLSGAWDQDERKWVTLGNEYKNSIRQGLRIANKQIAPDLVLLPVDTPEAS